MSMCFLRPVTMAGVAAVALLAMPLAATTGPSPQRAPSPLEAQLERIASASKGHVGVAALHLSSGDTVEWHAEDRFKMASTFKVPVAVYAMHLAETERLSLTEPLLVSRDEMLEPGILHEYFRHDGVAISTLNAIELSITRSDNGATDIIYERVGGPAAVNRWLQARGYTDMDAGSKTVKETFAGGAAPADPSWNPALDRTVTPRTMARFLADLHEGRLIPAARAATLLDIMSRTIGDRLALHLPPGTSVLHKTGTLSGSSGLSVNDVGYLRMPNGETIAIAVFIKNSPQSVSHATRDHVIGHVARTIHDYFLLSESRRSK